MTVLTMGANRADRRGLVIPNTVGRSLALRTSSSAINPSAVWRESVRERPYRLEARRSMRPTEPLDVVGREEELRFARQSFGQTNARVVSDPWGASSAAFSCRENGSRLLRR